MSAAVPVVCIARHGETAWTLSHRHAGVTDLPLTPKGEAEALRLRERLSGRTLRPYSPARCDGRCALANWPDSARWLSWIPTWLNGITRAHDGGDVLLFSSGH